MIWPLIILRYKLLWAHARTRTGKIAIFLALYLFGVSLFFFFTLGGISAVVAAIQLRHAEEEVTRWLLTGVYLNGLILTVAFGFGPRKVSSESVLRRYPLTRNRRLLVRHLTALCDPIWPLLCAMVFGLAIGLALLHPASILVGIPVAFVFTLIVYLSSILVLICIDRILEKRGGTAVLAILFAGVTFVAALYSPAAVRKHGSSIWLQLDHVLRSAPPGVAASLMAQSSGLRAWADAGALIIWVLLIASTVSALDRLQGGIRSPRTARTIRWDSLYDRLAKLFAPSSFPLVSKFLRYHFRCNRVRMNLVMVVPLLVLFPLMVGRNGETKLLLLFSTILFFAGGVIGTAAITLNQFGIDGAGVRRYALLPVPFFEAFRSASFTSILVGALGLLPAYVMWTVFVGSRLGTAAIIAILFVGIAGLYFFNALGVWSSFLSPRQVDFHSVLGNQLSLGANLVMIGGTAIACPVLLFAGGVWKMAGFTLWWWFFPLLALACIGVRLLSLSLLRKILTRKREAFIQSVAGAKAG